MEKRSVVQEKVSLVACVQRGMAFLGEDVLKSTVYFIEKRTNSRLQDLVREPERLTLTLREFFGLGSHLVFESILREIERVARTHEVDPELKRFASAIDQARASVETGTI
jgi:hypothetical protein